MRRTIYILFLTVFVIACKEQYNPPAINAPGTYLVVEGFVNSGAEPTNIKLSYTVKLSNTVSLVPALHALVSVQGSGNEVYPLTETSNGNYTLNGLNLNNSEKYRLSIKTPNNEQYFSDYVPVLNSPPIDSIYYKITGSGLNILSTTHDPTNTVQYYRWDYKETWVIHSAYFSYFISNGDSVVARDLINNEIYYCWPSDSSSTIILNSTARLKQAVLTDNPITSIVSTSEKLESKYSILVKQYPLTGDAYSFWSNLKKNTEQLGSIFDAQPSQISGNIHSVTNPAEPVIGYISVGSISSQRIFIQNQQLPAWSTLSPYASCQLDTFLYKYIPPGSKTVVNQVDQFINYNKGSGDIIPVLPISIPGHPPLGYSGSTPSCVDCTFRGPNKQPAFWK